MTEGEDKIIRVTESAVNKIKELLAKEKKNDYALRMRVIVGGCAGLSYRMDFTNKINKEDIIVEYDGIKIVVDPKSYIFLAGIILDYEDGLLNGGFKITNPNARGTCSCGQSFTA